jgi:hypothetical protein
MSADEKRIREFAYQIWESEGQPTGQEERHWEMARKLAEAEALAPDKSSARKASKPKLPAVDGAKDPKSGSKTTVKAAPAPKPADPAKAKPATKPADPAKAKSAPKSSAAKPPAAKPKAVAAPAPAPAQAEQPAKPAAKKPRKPSAS